MSSTRRKIPIWAAAASAIAFAACPTSDVSLRILGAYAPNPSCEPGRSKVEQMGGGLDLAGSAAYLLEFDVQSELESLKTSTANGELAGEDRNTFYGNKLVLSYASTPSLPFEREEVAVHAVVKPGASGRWIVDLIGPKAARRLLDSVAQGESYELSAKLQIQGTLASGQPVQSNTISFPITVYRTKPPTCASGVSYARNGPCGQYGGQDDSYLACCWNPDPEGKTQPDGGVLLVKDTKLTSYCP